MPVELAPEIFQTDNAYPPRALTDLRREILRRATSTLSHPSRNRGGWRSDESVLDWPIDGMPAFTAVLQQAVRKADARLLGASRRLRLHAWAVVNRSGSQHLRHDHNGSIWSGIYYFDDAVTATIFDASTGLLRIAPRAGRLVVFASNIMHEVEPCADEIRVTLAFDARLPRRAV